MIELPEDLSDLLIEFSDAAMDFVMLGGHAVAFYGHPRAMKDMDLLVRATMDNAEPVYQALSKFGAPLSAFEVQAADFATYDDVLQIGLPPRRIDILNRADGIGFDEAVAAGGKFRAARQADSVIELDALLKNKLAAGRPQDLADVAALRRRAGRPT